jgi:hypothetical protein
LPSILTWNSRTWCSGRASGLGTWSIQSGIALTLFVVEQGVCSKPLISNFDHANVFARAAGTPGTPNNSHCRTSADPPGEVTVWRHSGGLDDRGIDIASLCPTPMSKPGRVRRFRAARRSVFTSFHTRSKATQARTLPSKPRLVDEDNDNVAPYVQIQISCADLLLEFDGSYCSLRLWGGVEQYVPAAEHLCIKCEFYGNRHGYGLKQPFWNQLCPHLQR